MAEKPNKSMVIGIAVAVVAVIAIIIGVIVAKGNESGVGEGEDGTEMGRIEGGTNERDYSNVNVEVEFGDYDGMQTLSKSIQSGEMVGQIVKIDGYVSHPMSQFSVVEEDENGLKIGTVFEIEGLAESDYPQDGDRIIITGEVIEKEPMVYIIQTTPSYVDVIEILDEDDEDEVLDIEEDEDEEGIEDEDEDEDGDEETNF